jgi:hypothetical protein
MGKEKQTIQHEPTKPVSRVKKFKNGYSWEMDGKGLHRIVSSSGDVGDWALYSGVAVSSDGEFICVSQYYGYLPEQVKPEYPLDILSETLYKIVPIEAED